MQTSGPPGSTLTGMSSLDQHPSTRTDYAEAPRGPGSGRRIAVIVGVLVTVLAVAGVGFVLAGGDRQPSGLVLTEPSTAPAGPSAEPVAPPPVTLSEEEQILAQYRRFSASLTTLSNLPAAERPALLGEIATDPLYTQGLEGLAAGDAAGEINYGQAKVSPRVANIGLATAVVQDCQDGSQTGRARKSDGTKLTVGLAAELAVTQMRRGPDGIWRVAEVVYPPDRTC